MQLWNRLKFSTKSYLAGWIFVIAGIVFRLRQYLIGRSLWADEASLALNLVERSFSGLTKPLDYGQGAPLFFLFIEKISIIILGNKDYVMRLFPLFSGILAVYLFYLIAREYFGTHGLFAVLIFAISSPLIYYSSELKQYSSDVMLALLLVYLAGRCFKEKVRPADFLILGITGMIAIWVSHSATFILAGIGLTMLVEKMIRKNYVPLSWLFGMGIAWIAMFGMEYLVSLQYLIVDDFLQQYWHKAFMPLPPWSNLGWFEKTGYSLLYITMYRTDYILALIFIALIFIGGLSLLARNRNVALLVSLPFVIALIACALQKYPLKDRFMLFLVPFLLLIVSEGLGRIYSLIAKWNRAAALVVSAIPALVIISLTFPTTYSTFLRPFVPNIKPVISYVSENRAETDIVYVYHSAEPAFRYYAPFYGLDSGNVVIGYDTTRKKIALEGFFDDVEGFRGKPRVWFIFTDISDCGGCEGDMQTFYVDYLSSLGVLEDKFKGVGANAYLFNLNP